ncbi:MAG: hypothetical protein D6776_09095, partial [Planctomycetota bacterium]
MGGQRRAPIGVIVNPAAGRGQAVRAAEALLAHARAAGEPLLVRRSSGPGAATRLARALAPQVRALCAVGGDGTLHE